MARGAQKNTILLLAVLAAFCCLANVARGVYRERARGPRFEAESAAHFRYASMVARGERIPAVDVRAQWPEGLRVFRETSPAMEYLYGWVYRLLPGKKGDFAGFTRRFAAFLFSLAVFPLGLLSARLWRSAAAGAMTGLVFAVALPLVARSSGFEFIRENFSLPLIVLHAACFVAAFGGRRGAGALSAIALFGALLSWHGTQFYLVPLFAYMLARAVFDRPGADERRARRWVVAAAAVAGVAVPYLREARFLLSVPSALGAAYLAVDAAGALAARGRRRGTGRRAETAFADSRAARALVAAAVIAAVLVPAVLSGGHFSSYSHFFELSLYKIRYLGKPDDPRLLSPDARMFWVGPFNSPDPLHFFVFALPLLLLLPGPVSVLARRSQDRDLEARFVLVFLVVFFALFLLMQRLSPFFGVFAALAAGGNALELAGARPAAAVRKSALYLSIFAIAVSLFQVFAWEGRLDFWRNAARRLRIPSRERFVVYPHARDVSGDLYAWMRGNLPAGAVVMAPHYLSPGVLAHADRATNLNDFFESPGMRRKAERFLKSLYASEDELYRFAAEQGSTHLLLSSAAGCDPTKDSPLYQAGLVNMPPGCAAYRLLFEPERSIHFDLVYENEMYRLFRVGRPSAERSWPRSPLFYDRELLWNVGGNIRDFYHAAMRIYALTARGRSLALRGEQAEGERVFVEALRIFYFYPAWRELDGLYKRRGRLEEREAAAAFAHRMDPNRAETCLSLAESRVGLGRRDGVRELLEPCLKPGAPPEARSRAEAILGLIEEVPR